MPKFTAINPVFKWSSTQVFAMPGSNNVNSSQGGLPALLMELPGGSMVVNGQYVDAKTLTPKFGRIPSPVAMGTGTAGGAPYPIVTSSFRQMTQLANGLNTWLVSSYGRLNNNVYDGQYNKLHVYSVFPAHANNWTSVLNTAPESHILGPRVIQNSAWAPVAYTIWDGTTDTAVQDVNVNPAYATAAAYTNYGYMPMVFRIDTTTTSSTRYLWHCQGISGTTNTTYYTQLGAAATAAQPLMADLSNPSIFNPAQAQGVALTALGQTLVGTSNTATRVFLYADTNYIWFWETINPAPSTANYIGNVTQYLSIKKMSYGGVETVINNTIPKGLDGTHWPTQNLNETVSNVSIIIPTFEYVHNPRIIFRKLLIDKTSSTETLSNLTIPNDNGNVSTNIYRTQGYGNLYASLTSGGGTINDSNWRAHKHIMSWVTTQPSGNRYLMVGVGQTAYTVDATIWQYFKNGYKSYGWPSLDVNQQFKIWAWQLDAGLTTATYVGESDFSQIAPKYYFPLSDSWNTLYVGSIADQPVDTIWAFNEQYYQWQKIQTLPYNAAQVAIDGQSRLWTLVTTGDKWQAARDDLYLETVTIPYTANVVFANTSLVYSGAPISTSANVDVFDAYGTRMSANVTLTIVGTGMTFADGTTSNTYTTLKGSTTQYNLTINSGNYSRVVATINQIVS